MGPAVVLRGRHAIAAERIQIGQRVQVGANCTIADTDFHPITPEGRAQNFLAGAHASALLSTGAPILIEDDVFIGMQSLILKGLVLSRAPTRREAVTIGRGSVVGAGSVVVKDVPTGAPSPISRGGQSGANHKGVESIVGAFLLYVGAVKE